MIRRNQASLLRNVCLALRIEDVVLARSESVLNRVKGSDDSTASIRKRRSLYEDLSAHARVDARSGVVNVAAGVDVTGAEPDGRQTRVASLPVVVVVGDVEFAGILGPVAVSVAHERDFPVVVEFVPGDSHEIGAVFDVQGAVVGVFAADEASGGEVTVVWIGRGYR